MAQVLYETVLPSGRCVRYAALRTKEKLAIAKFVDQMKGDESSAAVQTVARCVMAYTEPQKLVRDNDGEVNIDATLDAVPAMAWRQTSALELTIDGDAHCTEVFGYLPDWEAVCAAISQASGYGAADKALMQGKARARSIER